MNETVEPVSPPPVPPLSEPHRFLTQLLVVTLGLGFLYLILLLLREFKVILQPLCIAVLMAYAILPVHRWLIRRGIPSVLAIVVMLALILGAFFGLGAIIYANVNQIMERLPDYQKRLQSLGASVRESLPVEIPDLSFSADQLRAVVGTFLDFFTGMAVTFVYLTFLVAERFSFPQRMVLAFGEKEGNRVLTIVDTINLAIGEYLGVKTFISFLAGVLSFVVLWYFSVDFFLMWGILIFVLNYIPYLGSLVAIALPIALCFLHKDPGTALTVAVALIGIQVALGNFVEPRMAGRRLGVSPLLILLSLSFWGLVWGIVGMILAVPLLVSIKIVLENIPATRPLATLMSNM